MSHTKQPPSDFLYFYEYITLSHDYINMFKRREIYRHLTNAAEHMAQCANTLHDIVVKIS